MKTELCLLHANCQGRPLALLLSASPEFSARWHVHGVVNYLREPLPDNLLRTATLFLYQNLTAKWEELASARVLAKLPDSARRLCIPNPFFKGYWPFWLGAGADKGIGFCDEFLEHMLDLELDAPAMLHIYLHKPLAAKYDLTARLYDSWGIEAQREALCDVKTLPFVQAHWREERLFTTINHPTPRLLRFIADGILQALGLPALTDDNMQQAGLIHAHALLCDPSPEDVFELPIHPQVAKFFNLSFCDEKTRYTLYDKRLCFAEYAAAYLESRRLGMDVRQYVCGLALP